MYIRHEDPMELEGYLDTAVEELENVKARFRSMDENDPDYNFVLNDMIGIVDQIEDLRERIRDAWDYEFDELR